MGQVCFASEENEQRIQELENLLKDQEVEKAQLKEKLDDQRERQRKYKKSKSSKRDEEASSEKIEQLTNEKKQVFKTMLKERKNVSKLEDQIQDYKTTISEMEDKMAKLKQEKKEAQKKAAEIAKKKKKGGRFGRFGRDKDKESDREDSGKDFGTKKIMDDIGPTKDYMKELGLNPIAKSAPSRGRGDTKSNKLGIKDARSARGYGSDGGVTSDSDYVGGATTTDNESSDGDQVLESKTTEILDMDYDPETEATHVYSWLHGQKIDSKNKQAVKQLKQRLASLLTSRSEGYRQTLIQAYRDQYGKNMEKDIKAIIVKGHAMDIIHGLLMTRAQYDAILISEYVANWDIEPVADIICCRSIVQLKELHDAYKKKCKLDVKKQLQALAQKDKKKTLVKVIGSIFNLDRKEKKDVDMSKINEDLNFVLTNKNFKGETKERLVLIFTANSVQFIKVLNEQFKLKSKDSLEKFIDKKLGPKSTAGHFCKTRIQYALDTPDYYAKKLKDLGKN